MPIYQHSRGQQKAMTKARARRLEAMRNTVMTHPVTGKSATWLEVSPGKWKNPLSLRIWSEDMAISIFLQQISLGPWRRWHSILGKLKKKRK